MTDVPVNDVLPLVTVSASGGQTIFSYPFLIQETSQLAVQRTQDPSGTPAVTTLTLNVDYSVQGTGSATGGTITLLPANFPSGATAGDQFTLFRDIPIERLTDFPFRGNFSASAINLELDRLTLVVQEIARDVLRSVALPINDPLSSAELPLQALRKNKDFQFDSAGAPLMVEPTDASGTSVTASGSTTSRSLAERFAEIVNVKDYGAIGDGVTDDTTAIQAAIDAVEAASGGIVFLPTGVYAISATLTVTASSVQLVGSGHYNLVDASGEPSTMPGTVLEWIGAASGTMVKFSPTTGATLPSLHGCYCNNMSFDAKFLAATCLLIESSKQGGFIGLHLRDYTVAGISTNVVSPLGEITTTADNLFMNISARSVTGAGAGAHCFDLDGDRSGVSPDNTTLNTFINCLAIHKDGDAYRLGNADANAFYNCRGVLGSGGTGALFRFRGDASFNVPARFNKIYGYAGTAPIVAGAGTFPSRQNYLYGRDDDGAEPTVVAGANLIFEGRVFIKKSSNETVNNSTTLQDDDELKFTMKANKVHYFRAWLKIQGNTTANFKCTFTFPTGATIRWNTSSGMVINPAGTAVLQQDRLVSGTATLSARGQTGNGTTLELKGFITVGGTPGDLQFQWAQDTADVSDTIVRAGSVLEVWRAY